MKTFPLLFIFIVGISGECCQKKSAPDGDTFNYHKTLEPSILGLPEKCHADRCMYTKQGDTSGILYCFGEGPMTYECTDESNDQTNTAKSSDVTTTGKADGITDSNTGGKIGFLFLKAVVLEGTKVESYPCEVTLPGDLAISRPFVAEVLDGKIHIIGQENFFDATSTMCYTGSLESTEPWEIKSKCFSSAKSGHSSVTVGQYILVIGGMVEWVYTDVIERYDGKVWTPLSNKLTSPRAYQCSVAKSETEFIVLGGNDGTGSIATMEKYDVDGKLVETLPSMTKARAQLGCTIFNNELYAAGGTIGTNFGDVEAEFRLSDVEVYNFDTKQWRAISNMNVKRWNPRLYIYDGKVTAFGGGSSVTSIEYFDGNKWQMSEGNLKRNVDVSVEIKCPA